MSSSRAKGSKTSPKRNTITVLYVPFMILFILVSFVGSVWCICIAQNRYHNSNLLLDIPVHYYQHRYLRDAYSMFGNGHFVLTEEGAGDPASKQASRSGSFAERGLV